MKMLNENRFTSSTDLRSVTTEIEPKIRELFAREQSLPKLAERITARGVKKLSLSSQRSINQFANSVFTLGLYRREATVIAVAKVLEAVPFTGNFTLYEPVRQVYALAYRLNNWKKNSYEVELGNYLTVPERGGPGPVLMTAELRERCGGLLLRRPLLKGDRSDSPTLEVERYLLELRELAVMWALGGSKTWPREEIEKEIAADEAYLLSLDGMKPQE
ncbi:MAG: DUF6707 family protein [Pseudonocardiaceae bacterium]